MTPNESGGYCNGCGRPLQALPLTVIVAEGHRLHFCTEGCFDDATERLPLLQGDEFVVLVFLWERLLDTDEAIVV